MLQYIYITLSNISFSPEIVPDSEAEEDNEEEEDEEQNSEEEGSGDSVGDDEARSDDGQVFFYCLVYIFISSFQG